MDSLIRKIKEQDKTENEKHKALLYVFSANTKEQALSLDGKRYEEKSLLPM